MFNSVATYEKLFTPTEGGYLFYPWGWSGGYLISYDEYESLVADWRRFNSWRTRVGMGLVLTAAIIVGNLTLTLVGRPAETGSWVPALPMTLALIGYVVWRFGAVYRLIFRRQPVAPPRRKAASRRQIASMMSWPLLIVISLGTSLTGIVLLFIGAQGAWLTGLAGVVITFSGVEYWRIVASKWNARRD